MQIREMTMDDIEQVAALEAENFSAPWGATGFFSFLIRQDVLLLVAEEEEKIIGYCGAVTVLDEGDITNVCVSADARRRGIASALIRELTARTLEQGVTTLHLEVRKSNDAAISLYQKEGFVQDGLRKGYYESPTEDAVLMSRHIQQ